MQKSALLCSGSAWTRCFVHSGGGWGRGRQGVNAASGRVFRAGPRAALLETGFPRATVEP